MTDLEQVAASHGFTAVKSEPISEVEGTVHLMHHAASGARLMFIENDDANKAFSITFKTPAADDTGVFHILEHSVLCGSEKFPVKEPFVNLLKGSMQTFLNAMTFPDKTMYPVASTNEQDLVNLMDVYLDAVFHPDIYRRPVIFQQEGWHRELEGEGEGERLVVNGVVHNEMKGALSEPDSVLYDGLSAALFPDTTYRFESGGTPAAIPTLTYEGFLDNHRRHYRPDNAYIILDEAQNTTREQMKMFLTRLGFGSKIVITGDITQIDLPSDKVSGLKDAVRILDNVPDIAICRLTASDVVRHALVQRIIAAYETAEHSAKNGLPGQKKVYRRKP